MGQILEAIVEFFSDDTWKATPIEGKTALGIHFNGDKGTWYCVAWGREEQSEFVFYSIYGQKVPSERRNAVGELVNRINYGMFIGNFEFDYDDGEVRYKTSVDVEEGELTQNLIRPVVFLNLNSMNKYLPAFQAVVNDNVEPSTALEQITESS